MKHTIAIFLLFAAGCLPVEENEMSEAHVAEPDAALVRTHKVTVTQSGDGEAAIMIADLVCEQSPCVAELPEGSQVTISVAESLHSTFMKWTAPCASQGLECTFVLGQDTSIDAEFGVSGKLLGAAPSEGIADREKCGDDFCVAYNGWAGTPPGLMSRVDSDDTVLWTSYNADSQETSVLRDIELDSAGDIFAVGEKTQANYFVTRIAPYDGVKYFRIDSWNFKMESVAVDNSDHILVPLSTRFRSEPSEFMGQYFSGGSWRNYAALLTKAGGLVKILEEVPALL